MKAPPNAKTVGGRRDALVGQSAGNYQLVSLMGMGGMGAVYLARHAMLGRPAAVKVLLPELSQHREIVNRFFNEAKAATAIRHPSIVEIYDFGFLPSGNAYIIMELLEGESLARRVERLGSLSPEATLVLLRQIAGALHAAHEQQIVHRDLKPDNVFVVRDPEIPGGERIKLLDFGIAKLASEIGDNRTRTGAVMGTPAYMSPEQCRGAGTIDSRTDLYALGCIFYELLCGRPPFLVEGSGDVIAHHLYFTPEPLRRHQPGLPERIEPLVMWLLQKEPSSRPSSAAKVIEAIDALGFGAPHADSNQPTPQGQPTGRPTAKPTTLGGAAAARPTTATMMVRAPIPRRWLPATGGALVVGGALVGWWPWGNEAATPRAPIAVLPVSPSTTAKAELSEEAAVDSPPIAAPVASALVRLAIESEPSGAEVWLDGERVGVTPFQVDAPRGETLRSYVLRRSGYLDASVSLSTAIDGSENVQLRRRPSAPPRATKQPARRARPRSASPETDLGDGVNPFE